MNKHHIWASAFAMLALTYGGKLLAQGRLDLDRKSTRLNSSHRN